MFDTRQNAVSPRSETSELKLPELDRAGTEVLKQSALSAIVSECGFKLKDLSNEEARIFLYAQEFEALIRDLKIPIATRAKQSAGKTLVEREVDKVLPLTRYTAGEEEVPVPANNLEVRQLRGINELPRIFPSQWVLDSVSPDLFLKKAAGGGLLIPQWTREMCNPITSQENQKIKELFEEAAPPDQLKQHAHVLIDRSGSMSEERIEKAKGLAVAFLLNGYRNRSAMYLRFFTDVVFPLNSARTQAEFHTLTKALLREPTDGDTDIRGALSAAVRDIRKDESARADILLLTDGEASLYDNPLGDIKLHTVILGDETNNPTLRSWSQTFQVLSDRHERPQIKPEEIEAKESLAKKILQVIEESKDAKEIEIALERLSEMLSELQLMERLGALDREDAKNLKQMLTESISDAEDKGGAEEIAETNITYALGEADFAHIDGLLTLKRSLEPARNLIARAREIKRQEARSETGVTTNV